MKDLRISCAMMSRAGERTYNEDYVSATQEACGSVFLLCDGLGGHGGGDIASALVAETMKLCLHDGMSLEQSADCAQQALLQEQALEHRESEMKSTLCALLVGEDNARFLHVGDSRIYLFERGRYKMRTQDHSVPQMLVYNGMIKESQIRRHADRSRLLRVMGTPWNEPKYQVTDAIAVGKGTSFLLCSDGFWELIEEKQMERTLRKSKGPEEWLQKMEEIILATGRGTNMDNYSAIAVFVRREKKGKQR